METTTSQTGTSDASSQTAGAPQPDAAAISVNGSNFSLTVPAISGATPGADYKIHLRIYWSTTPVIATQCDVHKPQPTMAAIYDNSLPYRPGTKIGPISLDAGSYVATMDVYDPKGERLFVGVTSFKTDAKSTSVAELILMRPKQCDEAVDNTGSSGVVIVPVLPDDPQTDEGDHEADEGGQQGEEGEQEGDEDAQTEGQSDGAVTDDAVEVVQNDEAVIENSSPLPQQDRFGDFDNNKRVDDVDFKRLLDAFGSATGDANYDIVCDVNRDGTIGAADFESFRVNYDGRWGDYDRNNVVDTADFDIFRGAFGSKEGEEKYNRLCDYNGDGAIGVLDFGQFRAVFGSPTPNETRLGDFDKNGRVDDLDIERFQRAFGSLKGEEKYDEECDFDLDGAVGIADFGKIRANYDGRWGDFNKDQVIDSADFELFRIAFGSRKGEFNYNRLCDFEGDGAVGIRDFGQFRSVFGGPTGPLGRLGDFDKNGRVDDLDLDRFKAAFGSLKGDAKYDEECDFDLDGAVGVADFGKIRANYDGRWGDFNKDGKVDTADFDIFKAAFGSLKTDEKYNRLCDFDGDGAIGISDFGQFRAVFGK